ncbi:outer membrane protein assembly factor BamD [Persicobacter diffluens]|uniref:Outer membrane protein assembly factor BamD n=1 Tax=Persicobacter diffluens TaxID=981 RepID=A0AAN5AL22_9BACT|nr:outer membrane protein assembly factor BamD [Persicobacter diffluens]
MHKNKVKLLLGLFILPLISSCATEYRKAQKSTDNEYKYQVAMDLYQREKWYKANNLFEQIMPAMRGTEEAEDMQFKYAYGCYNQKQYTMSSHYFKTFYQTYSRSEKAEEAMYMSAYSLVKDSPREELDQSSTTEAISALQSFLNKYPNSEYAPEGNRIIGELQEKLATKAYLIAKQYYLLRKWKAAMVTFENFRKDFPDSKYNEELAFLRLESSHTLATQSTYQKKEDRFSETIEIYQKFIEKYPESTYLKSAEKLYGDSLNQLEKIAKNKNS